MYSNGPTLLPVLSAIATATGFYGLLTKKPFNKLPATLRFVTVFAMIAAVVIVIGFLALAYMLRNLR